MFKFINKIKKINFRFDFPKTNSILQYDHHHSDILRKTLKKEINVLSRRKMEIYFWIFLKQVIFLDFSFLTYFKNYIKYTSTKIVINCIDNDLNYYTFKKHIEGVYFLAIQNGVRPPNSIIFQNKKLKNLKCDYFFLFNKFLIKQFKKKLKSEFYVMGNFHNNMIKVRKTCHLKSFLFISRGNIDAPLLNQLATYFIKSNKKINILLKSKDILNQKKEIEFYKFFFKSNCIFKKCNTWQKTYQTLDKFENIIFTNSTLGYEAIARKKKVAVFPLNQEKFDKNVFGWPKKKKKNYNFFLANSISYPEVERILDNIYNCNQERWENKYFKSISDLMYFNKDNYYLKDIVNKLLEKKL